MNINVQRVLLIVLLIWSIISTSTTVYYYIELENSRRAYRRLCEEVESLHGELEKLGIKIKEWEDLYSRLKAKVIVVNIGIDYGNNTCVWYNNTLLPVGSTVLSATIQVATVEYKLGAWGAYVTSINGVKERIITPGKEGYSWIWLFYNTTSGKLEWGPVAADRYKLSDGDIIVWKYSYWKF